MVSRVTSSTAKSAASATTQRRPSQWSRHAANSVAAAMTRIDTAQTVGACVSRNNAVVVTRPASVAIQAMGVRFRCQPMANPNTVKQTATTDAASGGIRWKLTVISHSIGAMIRAAVRP